MGAPSFSVSAAAMALFEGPRRKILRHSDFLGCTGFAFCSNTTGMVPMRPTASKFCKQRLRVSHPTRERDSGRACWSELVIQGERRWARLSVHQGDQVEPTFRPTLGTTCHINTSRREHINSTGRESTDIVRRIPLFLRQRRALRPILHRHPAGTRAQHHTLARRDRGLPSCLDAP